MLTARKACGVLVLILSLTLPACNETLTEVELDGSGWTLAVVRGKPASPLALSSVAMWFGPTAVNGFAGCNFFGAAYETSGSEIRFESIHSTDMACSPTERMTHESEFLVALGATQTYRVYADRLELLDAGGQLTLGFTRGVPSAE